jgi:hypothetical protein
MPFGQGRFNAAPTNCCIQLIIYTSRSSDLPTSSADKGSPRLPSRGANSTLTEFLLGHASVQTTGKYLGCKQRLREAVNDQIGIEPGSKLVPLTANSTG